MLGGSPNGGITNASVYLGGWHVPFGELYTSMYQNEVLFYCVQADPQVAFDSIKENEVYFSIN